MSSVEMRHDGTTVCSGAISNPATQHGVVSPADAGLCGPCYRSCQKIRTAQIHTTRHLMGTDIDGLPFDLEQVFPFESKRDTRSLYDAAEAGCFICSKVWDTAFQELQVSLEGCSPEDILSKSIQVNVLAHLVWGDTDVRRSLRPTQLILETLLGDSAAAANLEYSHNYNQNLPKTALYPLRLNITDAGPDSETIRRVGNNTNSEAAWCRISGWFDSCIHTHSTCGRRRLQNQWYPSLLLDVGDLGTETVTVNLLHTASTPPNGPYLTLSHCWGGSVPTRTTRETETSFKRGIPITSLPQTFRDAVQVTRKLKARYLWIDSLCILQDDHDDWTREASFMDRVYENALCNIAATAAETSQGGLFFNRRPWLASPVIHDEFGAFQLSKADMFEEEIGESPLQQRAWVFQERQISPRVLHFGKNQIFWECGELFANETYPEGLSSFHSLYPLGLGVASTSESTPFLALRHLFRWDSLPISNRVKRHKHGLLYVWKTMIQRFSALDLTFETDKLPGFAGIARRFKHLLGPRYLAGLWPSHSPEFFVMQLAWHVPGPSGRSHDEPYLAPSWSWASAQGYVHFSEFPNPEQADSWGRHERFLIGTRFLDAHVDAATWDTFGPVKCGYIKVEGPLNKYTDMGGDEEDSRVTYFDHVRAPPEEWDGLFVLSLYSWASWNFDEDSEIGYHMRYWTYLLVRPIDGQLGAYRRCGIVSVVDDQLTMSTHPHWRVVSGHNAPCDSFVSEERGHILRIY